MDFQKIILVFIIIFIPIYLVLSTYIRNQVDTLELQAEYKKMLVDSTYDAINAYQMNTMSSTIAVGEDNKRYVLASVNTFFNSLATNMGVTGTDMHDLQQYVPAILFTNYDGYYIYSPTKMPVVATNEKGVGWTKGFDVRYKKKDKSSVVAKKNLDSDTTTDINSRDTEMTYDYMVKPFVYYSATYSDTNYNVVINYSLDNYITVYGKVSNDNGLTWTMFNKAGYLIDTDKVKISGNIYMETLKKRWDKR